MRATFPKIRALEKYPDLVPKITTETTCQRPAFAFKTRIVYIKKTLVLLLFPQLRIE